MCVITCVAVVATQFRSVASQVFSSPQGKVENVRFEQTAAGTITVTYDLTSSDPTATFQIMLEVSRDGGKTFTVQPKSVSGDIGQGVRPGPGKRILWEASKDIEALVIDQFRFNVRAISGVAAPVGAPRTAPATTTSVGRTGGGSSTRWIIIGGAAGAAGVAAALLGGKTTSITPTTTTAATTTIPQNAPTLANPTVEPNGDFIAAATQALFSISASDPDGNSMTARWEFGDGTTADGTVSAGRATITKTFANAGAYTTRVIVTDSTGRSANSTFRTIVVGTVTGRWSGFLSDLPCAPERCYNVTINLNQNGSSVGGQYQDQFGRTSGVTGNVSNPRRLSFRVTVGPGVPGTGGTISFELNGTIDLRTFEGTAGERPPLALFTMTRQ
jgi:hypothetical protein